MPAAYTHYKIAEQAFACLPSAIQSKLSPHLTLYYFGAQGADFCFFYPVVDGKNTANLGGYLHRKGGFSAFAVCKAFARDDALFAYSLGYITHYAADVIFHPYVYALSGRSPLRHTRIEGALDDHFKTAYPYNGENVQKYLYKKPPKAQVDELFLLYAAIAANAGFPPLQKPAFHRSVRLFNAYLLRLNRILTVKKDRLSSEAINAEKREWAYPLAPEKRSRDGATELFEKAIDLSLFAIDEFVHAIKNRTPLSFETFGKHYLSGL